MSRATTIRFSALLAIFLATTLHAISADAAVEKLLHRFAPFGRGEFPLGLIADSSGNFFGTAQSGGAFNQGVVYKISPNAQGGWTNTVIYSFRGNGDGQYPKAEPVLDAAGNLYGATYGDGIASWGSVFKLTPGSDGSWKESVLYSFDGSDGQLSGSLTVDGEGNVFGSTYDWGPLYGTVYELKPSGGSWTKTTLYTFTGGNDGGAPGSLVVDKAGNVYGAAGYGAARVGVIFELRQSSSGIWTESVLHTFTGGSDGSGPLGLTFDNAGNLYGTTSSGGNAAGCNSSGGCGTVFEMTPGTNGQWTETMLYSFGNVNRWEVGPLGVVFDNAGNLYGATYGGGIGLCYSGCGTVFKLSPRSNGQWTETLLHAFTAQNDGYNPYGDVVLSASGHVFGTTYLGGRDGDLNGTIFELIPASGNQWSEKVYEFPLTDGAVPMAEVIADSSGNLYGTTIGGGPYNAGTVFELTPSGKNGWKETLIYTFNSGLVSSPAGLIFDHAGNLYGATGFGGASQHGSVFELSQVAGGGWQEKDLISFSSVGGPVEPVGALVFDSAGHLYGVTSQGGAHGLGTVFELTRSASGQWTAQVIHSFSGYPSDGANPQAGLIVDSAGNLYGTTQRGGSSAECTGGIGNIVGCGTVFRLTLSLGLGWQENVLYSFMGAGNGDGADPVGSLLMDSAGNLYGTTSLGGMRVQLLWQSARLWHRF
jgi:uncharacterized repeat protein (TIGR03803 family)